MSDEKKMCSCGSPQSYPIPHEHDMTERELLILKQYAIETEKIKQERDERIEKLQFELLELKQKTKATAEEIFKEIDKLIDCPDNIGMIDNLLIEYVELKKKFGVGCEEG